LICDIESGVCATEPSNEIAHSAIKAENKILKVIYFTDPICSSCWGIEPQLRKLKLEYGHALDFQYRMGGLLPDWSYNSGGISKPSDVAHHWEEVSAYYDMPIDGLGVRNEVEVTESASADGPLDRALAILDHIAGQIKAVSVAEIAKALSLPLPTAHRLIGNLEERGLIQKTLGAKRYVVGNQLVTLSARVIGSAFRTARRHAVLRAVAGEIGEQGQDRHEHQAGQEPGHDQYPQRVGPHRPKGVGGEARAPWPGFNPGTIVAGHQVRTSHTGGRGKSCAG